MDRYFYKRSGNRFLVYDTRITHNIRSPFENFWRASAIVVLSVDFEWRVKRIVKEMNLGIPYNPSRSYTREEMGRVGL